MKQFGRKQYGFQSGLWFISLILIASPLWSQEKVTKTFPAKKLVEISTMSSDCIIEKGPGGKITVVVEYSVRPGDAFTPEMEERSDRIKLSEDWSGNASGKVLWTVTVPAETEIDAESASGDISITGLNKEIEVSTASGDITLRECGGDMEISTASGDVEIEDTEGELEVSVASGDILTTNVEGNIELQSASGDIEMNKTSGEFDLSCASGNIEADKVEIKASSEFSAASGDILLSLAASCQHDLNLSAASGDITLDYDGNDLKGRFELIARHGGGRISAPVKFDSEETFERHGRDYDKKIISHYGDNPLISLESASGSITLK
jgi:DUF4097 and DUF4098 domain-containing protein YvlB